jgi:ribonuclease P/MRP protein subunit RPP40
MMLSEGTIGVDNVCLLKSGKLTLFLDKETYERAGLVGKPHGVKGKRGLKPRWGMYTAYGIVGLMLRIANFRASC